MVWIPFWAAGVVNGLGHFWGYRNFSPRDASTNISPWGILIGGEELHNNHHTFPTSAKLSIHWYEFDIGWLYIRILTALGLAQVKKVAPRPRLGSLRPVVDFDTLQAVITNRYDVLSQYARSLKQVYREELGTLQDGSRFKGLKCWLAADAGTVPQEQRGRLELLLGESRALQTAYAMRQDLVAVWERSNAPASTCSNTAGLVRACRELRRPAVAGTVAAPAQLCAGLIGQADAPVVACLPSACWRWRRLA
jgi:stearoyl-CoA desaturase (delta-9 desaturase)